MSLNRNGGARVLAPISTDVGGHGLANPGNP